MFFGHRMNRKIAAVNEKTLSIPESGLYDLTAKPKFTASRVREMIRSYEFPEAAYFDGDPADEKRKADIEANRNLWALSDESFGLKYAILTDNAAVRAFPTSVKASDGTEENSFDLLQESMFAVGEGVEVLHTSLDGEWVFVQGSNYFGWIESGKAAFTDAETFRGYLSEENFLVVLKPYFEASGRVFRLGTVIPYRVKAQDAYVVLLPKRDTSGSLELVSEIWQDSETLSDGFLPYSPEALADRSGELVGTPYGWGDTEADYDCSSTMGLLYRCYGFYLPRNTSALPYFAGGKDYSIDVKDLPDEEKLALIAEHPGALLVMPGHVMLFTGIRQAADGEPEYTVVHNTIGYYTAPGGKSLRSLYRTVKTGLREMYRKNGDSYLKSIHTIVYFTAE